MNLPLHEHSMNSFSQNIRNRFNVFHSWIGFFEWTQTTCSLWRCYDSNNDDLNPWFGFCNPAISGLCFVRHILIYFRKDTFSNYITLIFHIVEIIACFTKSLNFRECASGHTFNRFAKVNICRYTFFTAC